MPDRLQRAILQLLRRATGIAGGSETLLTRLGILSWIYARLALGDSNGDALKRLATRLYETCDQDYMLEWCGEDLADHVAGLVS